MNVYISSSVLGDQAMFNFKFFSRIKRAEIFVERENFFSFTNVKIYLSEIFRIPSQSNICISLIWRPTCLGNLNYLKYNYLRIICIF